MNHIYKSLFFSCLNGSKENKILNLNKVVFDQKLGLCKVLLFLLLSYSLSWGQSTVNYTFSTTTTGSLSLDSNGYGIDMTTGTTTLLDRTSNSGSPDDVASSVVSIGFDFIGMAKFYSSFSVNSNGAMALGSTAVGTSGTTNGGSTTSLFLAPFGGDQGIPAAVGSNSKIHYKLFGTAPNRVLVIEWNGMKMNNTDYAAATIGDGTYQVRLYESSNIIEYVYGEMNVTNAFSTAPIIGFSTGTTAGKIASIVSATDAVITNGTSFSNNTYAVGNITNLHSTTEGSRKTYKFTPRPAPAAPTNFAANSIIATSYTISWTDNANNENAYLIYRSTDGVNYSLVYTTSLFPTNGNSTSYTANGLTPSTTYYWRVAAVNEGGISSNLEGFQATTAPAVYYYVGTNAFFSTLANWNTSADGTGTTLTAFNSTDVFIVDGKGTNPGETTLLYFDNVTIGQLKITNNTILNIASTTSGTKTITITGGTGDDLIVENGSTLNFDSTSNFIAITFSGSNNTGDISGNLLLRNGNTLTTTSGTNTIVTVKSTGVVTIAGSNMALVGSAASLIFVNGSNCNITGAGQVYPYPLPIAAWAANSTLTLTGSSSSTVTPLNMAQTFGNFVVDLTAITGPLSFWTTSTTAVIQGDLIINNTNTGLFCALTTGTLTINGNLYINGGKFQHSSSSGTLIVSGNTIIGPSGTLDFSAASTGSISQRGTTFTNNGTIIGGGTLSFFSPTNQALTFDGTGTITAKFAVVSVQTSGGLTISHSNQIPTLRVNLISGTITGSAKITIGTGLNLACITQIGSVGSTSPGGSFDASPTFNLGSGSYGVIYAQESVSRTTGYEIPSTRIVSNITNSNSNGIELAGGNLSTAALTFSTGCGNIKTTSSNILKITSTSTSAINRSSTTAFVNGPLEITLPASLASGSTYFIPVGKSAIKALELVNPKTNSGGPVVVQTEVFDASTGGTGVNLIGSIDTNRYWAVSITSGSSNFTNTSIRLNDVTTGFDAIASSSTLAGSYNIIGGINATITATTIANSLPALTTLPGYFVMGTKSVPTLTDVAISPAGNQCTNVSRAITVTATPVGGSVSSVVLNYSKNGVAQTAIPMTNTSGNNWTGTIPTVTPANANITWSVTATDSNALTRTATGIAYSDQPNLGIVASATASLSSVCAGNNASLSMNLVKNDTGVIGSGAVSSSSSTTPFSGTYGGMKGQYIILASELISAGYSAGNITGVGINFASAVSTTYNGLSIQIGNTSLNAFNSTLNLESNLTTVYGPTNLVNPAAGVKIFTLTTPFNWDGVSNIIISTSWSNNTTTSTSASVITTTTSANLAQIHKVDNYTPAGLLALTGTQSAGSSTVDTVRPNFTIIGNKALEASTYSWSDGTTVVGTSNTIIVTPSITTTYTGTATINGCPIIATTTVTANTCLNTWTGSTSSSWNTASNWSLSTVPTATDDVLISSNGSNPPVMNVDVTIPVGKSFTINGTGTLTIAPGKTLTIAGTADFGGMPVTFKSDATGSGMLGTLTGTLTGATNVKVERFIPSGKRAFRLLSPAVTTTTFISGNWQQQTHITGGASGGFDVTETNNPSMFTYDNQAAQGVSGWTPILNTNATNLTAGVGYRVLVRGDRTATNITAATTDAMNAAITLSATGTLKTGTVTLNSSSTPSINNTANTTTADYSLVGNPYQSVVDWHAVTKSGIEATYWAWDPNMGTPGVQRGRYVSYNVSSGSSDNVSQVGQYIQPGQAFFVKNTTSGTAGTLTFEEADKATTSANVFRNANQTESENLTSLSVQLYDPNELAIGAYPIDATKAVFNAEYTNELGLGDAAKLEAAGENIAWFRNNTKLAIDAAAPVTTSDELAMKTLRLGANKNYTFKIQTTNFDADLTPYLVDNFLNTQTAISTSEVYLANFSTTSNVASYGEDRFKIVFQTSALSTDDFVKNIKLYPNPSKAGGSFYVDGIREATVLVYNVVGQNIPVTVMSQGSAVQVTPKIALSQGVYLVTVTTAGKTAQVKWIVE